MLETNYLGWEAVRTGRLDLDCRAIEVKPNDPAQTSYSGPGRIYQDEDGKLRIKCYCVESNPNTFSDSLHRLSRVKAGKLFERNDLFSISAAAFGGRAWECKDVSISASHDLQVGSVIVTARPSHLTATWAVSGATGSSLSLLLPDQQSHEWEGIIGADWCIGAPYTGYRVQISSPGETEIVVSVSSESCFPDGFHVRVMEALRYVSGRVLSLSRMQRGDGENVTATLYSAAPVRQKRPFPPLDIRYERNALGVAHLFERYLAYASSHDVRDTWHPCSAYLSDAYEASESSLEAWAVGLCVALEGVAGLVPMPQSQETAATIKQIQKVARRQLKLRKVEQHLQDRVNGLLSQLSHTRVIDRLRPLIERGYLTDTHVRTWRNLRNSRVHTARIGPNDYSDEAIQKMIDSIYTVYSALYQITFFMVGYQGEYIDYGSTNFPVRKYPHSVHGAILAPVSSV
ncbi:hypothetical protein JKG68_07410 [Microvirga aerilata]|uniref:ApeA N-terminal domain-containing protein n=1 Tax=Microvirga aerilata TaxID=670292 RepID=A0A937CYT4_9HYPH|nr:hypothetical protein [Microvirga aerilata]MBL0403786.1 hypothetical protein [Microvirga aerilata]